MRLCIKMVDKAKKYFNCTDRDRAVFEAGIKLGTIYHQFVGIPVNINNIKVLEKAIEESVKVQPFVETVTVHIDRSRLQKKQGLYKYLTLYGDMLDVALTIKYENTRIYSRLKYVEDMKYPLMYITDIREE